MMTTTNTKFTLENRLSKYTTIGAGGLAKYLYVVTSERHLSTLLKAHPDEPLLVLGRGSNAVISDRGFDGVVIINKIEGFEIDANQVVCGGGVNFSLVGVRSAKAGLAGLEFACGIPGSVGGAVVMNAGANGQETCDHLSMVRAMTRTGDIVTYTRDELSFSYRMSSFQKSGEIVVGAHFDLQYDAAARQRQIDILSRRQATQPLRESSAGCIFRNPPGGSAGQLIEQAGLKGLRVGGAEVSSVHANFIINKEGASGSDIAALADLVQQRVKEATGICLEREVRLIGDFSS